jgi:hypothetical protein
MKIMLRAVMVILEEGAVLEIVIMKRMMILIMM